MHYHITDVGGATTTSQKILAL